MSDWTHIGAHRLRQEGDLAVIRLCGLLTLAESQEFLVVLERVMQQFGRLYMLFDNSELPKLDPAALRLFIGWTQTHPLSGVANFGGGVVQRTMALLLMNAMRLLVKKTPPQTYVATEAEARAWLDKQRRLPPDLAA